VLKCGVRSREIDRAARRTLLSASDLREKRMRNSRIEIRPIAGALGAEIAGVGIAEDLDEATIAGIREALNRHCVIFFRDQQLDAERHKAFARRFGDIFIHPNYQGVGDDDEVVMVRREPGLSCARYTSAGCRSAGSGARSREVVDAGESLTTRAESDGVTRDCITFTNYLWEHSFS